MENRRRDHVNKHMIKDDMLNVIDLRDKFPSEGLFVMDTESCSKHHNFEMITKDIADFTKKLQPKIEDHKGKKVWNPQYNREVHVYAYAIGNTQSDYIIYGDNLSNMWDVFDMIIECNTFKRGLDATKELSKIKCFVHNLGWDMEFMKYNLLDLGYEYYNAPIENNKKTNKPQPTHSFSIVENNNITYQSTVTLPNAIRHKSSRKNKKGEYKTEYITKEINFIDSMKIMPKSLDQIGRKVIKIDEMFLKMGADYDYEKWRPVGHILTQFEKEYLYNDIYILKEFLVQFYLPLGTDQVTASSIAFETFVNKTYGQPTLAENYKLFEEQFPDLSSKETIYNIIKDSYRGGWTQANKKYVGVKQKLKNAVSIDINSSYPAVVRYKPLPFGKPLYFEGKLEKEEYPSSYNMALLTIHFDAFKNNDEDNLIGEIQCGAENSHEFGCSGTEYIHTNFGGGEEIGDTIYNIEWIKGYSDPTEKHRYTMHIWDFELENMLERMSFYQLDKTYAPYAECYIEGSTLTKGYEVSSSLVFKSQIGFFGDVVDELVIAKNKGKLEGNNCLQEDAKLKMNSFYGKMGSKYEREERKLVLDEETGLCEFESIGATYDSARKYYPAFASAVTAWARVNLRTTLYKVGYNDVLYWDTDSLYTRVDAKTITERCGDILHKTELGKWDLEKEYTEFKAIGAKKYILLGHEYGKKDKDKIMCKCAGLPSEVRETIRFEDFYLGNTFHGKKVKTKMIGGYDLIKGSYKLNSSSF